MTDNYMDLENVLARHGKIAVQFSGGRDSLACLMLLLPYRESVTIYHVDTGDQMPEVTNLVEQMREVFPNFVVIHGDSEKVRLDHGLPSDIIPISSLPFHEAVSQKPQIKLQDRYSCCARTMMKPMHERMLADGITLIIRGQRKSDTLKSPVRSGDVIDGIEYFYPIDDWSDEQVNKSLDGSVGVPSFYSELKSTPDCMTCSAWWEKGRAKYLRKHFPVAYEQYSDYLQIINEAIAPHIQQYNSEVNSDGA